MATVDTDTVTLSINGRDITVPKGLSLVEAAAEAGIEVPVFCYEPRIGPAVGACRMCLVEIEGMPKLQTACTTPAGDGMIVQRGFPRPPSFHEPRLRDAPEGHFFHVITHGYGVMYSYASRVEPEERWAIIAYVRALQSAQNATLNDVPADDRARLSANEDSHGGQH